MSTASIRDLRTRFPKIRRMVESEGQLVITDRGRPIMVLQPYRERPAQRASGPDYYARLRRRMPKSLPAAAREALNVDRDER